MATRLGHMNQPQISRTFGMVFKLRVLCLWCRYLTLRAPKWGAQKQWLLEYLTFIYTSVLPKNAHPPNFWAAGSLTLLMSCFKNLSNSIPPFFFLKRSWSFPRWKDDRDLPGVSTRLDSACGSTPKRFARSEAAGGSPGLESKAASVLGRGSFYGISTAMALFLKHFGCYSCGSGDFKRYLNDIYIYNIQTVRDGEKGIPWTWESLAAIPCFLLLRIFTSKVVVDVRPAPFFGKNYIRVPRTMLTINMPKTTTKVDALEATSAFATVTNCQWINLWNASFRRTLQKQVGDSWPKKESWWWLKG